MTDALKKGGGVQAPLRDWTHHIYFTSPPNWKDVIEWELAK